MLYRSLAAAVALFVVVGFVLAGTYNGQITKITKDEVTIKVRKDKKDKEGEEKKFKIGKDAKILKGAGKDKEATAATADDLTAAIEKSKNKAVQAKIETEGEGEKETVTKITFGGGKKGK